MGKPTSLLEGLCGHAVSLGAQAIEVEHKDGREWVFASQGSIGIGIANYASSSTDGKELRGNLRAGTKNRFAPRSRDGSIFSKFACSIVLAKMPLR